MFISCRQAEFLLLPAFGTEQIDRQQKRNQEQQHAFSRADRHRQDRIEIIFDVIRNRVQDRFGGADNAVQIQHRGGNPDPVEYVVDRRCVFVQICDEHLNALNQLRNQNQPAVLLRAPRRQNRHTGYAHSEGPSF